jgi:hypothetical protein
MTKSKHANKSQPPRRLKSHIERRPLREDSELFMPPPPAIGELISAGTDLLISQKTSKSKRNAIIAGIVGIVLILISLSLLPGVDSKGFISGLVFWIGGILLIGATWIFINQFKNTCTYVGTNGIVQYKRTILTAKRPTEKMLIFTNTLALYSNLTHRYVNGRYSATHYSYGWKDTKGVNAFKFNIVSYFKSVTGSPEDTNIWHFFNAAESAWTKYLLQNIDTQLSTDGCLEFPVVNGPNSLQLVRINSSFLEFVTRKNGVQRVTAGQIAKISTDGGIFVLNHVNSNWWSERGKSSFSVNNTSGQFSFEYSSMPNVRLFLTYVEMLKHH